MPRGLTGSISHAFNSFFSVGAAYIEAGANAFVEAQLSKPLDQHGYLRLWPHRHGSDGFFAAVWERR